MAKHLVKAFTADCPLCKDAVRLARSVVRDHCDLLILDRKNQAAHKRAQLRGVTRVPAVVVDGQLAKSHQTGAETRNSPT